MIARKDFVIKCVGVAAVVYLVVHGLIAFNHGEFEVKTEGPEVQEPQKYESWMQNQEVDMFLKPIFDSLNSYTGGLERIVRKRCQKEAKRRDTPESDYCREYVADAKRIRSELVNDVRDSITQKGPQVCHVPLGEQFNGILDKVAEKCDQEIQSLIKEVMLTPNDGDKNDVISKTAEKKRLEAWNFVRRREPVDVSDLSLGEPPKPGSILILSGSDTKPSKDKRWTFFQQAVHQRDAYAKYYGLQHEFINFTKFDPGKDFVEHPVWLKLPAMQEVFGKHPEVEWIWWLDLDVVLTNGSFSIIDNILHPKALEKYFMYDLPITDAGESFYHGSRLPSRGKVDFKNLQFLFTHDNLTLNAGSFFIRRSELTQLVLEIWGNQRLIYNDKHDKRFARREQDAFIDLVMNHKAIQDVVGVVPQGLFNSYNARTYRPGDLLVHFAGFFSGDEPINSWDGLYKEFQLPDGSYKHILLETEEKEENQEEKNKNKEENKDDQTKENKDDNKDEKKEEEKKDDQTKENKDEKKEENKDDQTNENKDDHKDNK